MRHGLVALGDSITKGEGNMTLGVQCQSWALWLAQALALPFTGLAANGALSGDVVREQLPQLVGPYDLGGLYLGVNDARAPSWDAGRFEENLRTVLGRLGEISERTLALTLPVDLGRPHAGGTGEANAVIRRVAADAGAVLVELEDLRGWPLVLPDAVHPTALGQLDIAERAAAALAAAGVRVARRPGELAEVDDRRRTAAGSRAGWARMLARDLVRRGVERIRPPAAP
jgi:lysophospholipase L1-like esterase